MAGLDHIFLACGVSGTECSEFWKEENNVVCRQHIHVHTFSSVHVTWGGRVGPPWMPSTSKYTEQD